MRARRIEHPVLPPTLHLRRFSFDLLRGVASHSQQLFGLQVSKADGVMVWVSVDGVLDSIHIVGIYLASYK